MAAEKKQGNPERVDGGAPDAGLRERVQDVTNRLQDQAARAGGRIHEDYDAARETLARGYDRSRGMVVERPMTSTLVSFGVGLGVGLLLTLLLTEREESWYERYVPDSLRNLPDRVRDLNLAEAISRHLPRG